MKVSFGYKLQDGAWGGGNQLIKALTKGLRAKGVEVVFDLQDSDIDVLFVGDPRPELQITSFTHHDTVRYQREINPQAVSVYRVSDCDERKGHHGIFNPLAREAASYTDMVLWGSNWLRELHLAQGMQPHHEKYLWNGADRSIFHSNGYQPWDGKSPLKLVTHHWGGVWTKGFDIYQWLDEHQPQMAERFRFTYIGNVPEGFAFKHAQYISPKNGHELADLLRSQHVYVTGAQMEPGGNHHLEGGSCGLPLLYRESGGLPDYCQGYGVSFQSDEDFGEKLEQMLQEYPHWLAQMEHYPFSSDATAEQFFEICTELVSQREQIIEARSWQPHLTQPFDWLKGLKPEILRFLKSLHGEPTGQYKIACQGLTPEGEHIQLPWSAWALKIYYMLGAWDSLPRSEQQAWIDFILKFQVEGNPQFLAWGKNAFRDPVLMEAVQNQTRRLIRWKNRFVQPFTGESLALSAETKQAIATLQEIGVQTRFPYQGFPNTESALRRYLNALDWTKPWMSGAHIATLAVFYATEAPRFLRPERVDKLKGICAEFIAHLADSKTGAYFLNEKPPYGELVNGAMKILTALDWLEIPIHYPPALIDTVLSEYPQAEGCYLVDAVYVLFRCQQQTDYRAADIRAYYLKMIQMMEAHFNPIDGGFSYYAGRSQSHIHHVRITRQRPVSDLHGTLLLTWAASMILNGLGEGDSWRVIRP